MRARRRNDAGGPRVAGQHAGHSSHGGRGNVHPNAPSHVHNTIRAIEPKTVNKARQADYVRKYGSAPK